MDINEKVLAAFQAEHKEQLEGIRTLLAQLGSDENSDQPERINEAFRLAHSLKGGARVCDLRPAETLAHGLENVFEQVRVGERRLDKDVLKTINVVLDAIEDWMAALDRNETPAEPHEALATIERLFEGNANDDAISPETDGDVAQRLVDAFRGECPQYIEGLRQFAAILGNDGGDVSPDDIEEAYRLAHNLRGSAHAAEIESISEVGESVETMIAGFRDDESVPNASARERLKRHLDTIDGILTSLVNSRRAVVLAADQKSNDGATTDSASETAEPGKDASGESAKPKTNGRHVDTVRISTESLDKILRSSRQLVTESVSQEHLDRELQEIRRQVNQLQRDRDSIRRIAAASLHRLSTTPEFSRVSNYFETVDRGVQSLARSTRRICALQKRNSWRLQSRGRQIQQDVRQARMVPAEEIYQGLRKLVRDLAKDEGKEVDFRVTGFNVRADRMVFQALKDPLIHMLRNCIVHGIEPPAERTKAGKSVTCRVELRIETVGNLLTIDVEDDGRGIDRERIAKRAIERGLMSQADVEELAPEQIDDLIFQPGFSTSDEVTEIAGRGMGLSVVRDAATRLQGDVQVFPQEAGTKFRIGVALCVSTHRLLLVSAANQTYALPVHGIERLLRVKVSDMETIEGKPVVTFNDRPVPLFSLTGALGLESASLKSSGDTLQIAILKSNTRRLAVSVDAFVAEKDLLIHDLEPPAASKGCLGAILLEDGNVALVLNPAELLERARRSALKIVVEGAPVKAKTRVPRVLVVDDSFTTRTLEKSILEANGYDVAIAVDGLEGLNRLKVEAYDLVISDVEMPRMDGFTLLEEIKSDRRLSSTPVILVTSRARSEDQEKGLDLGAEAYIVKQKFDHQSLLNTIRQIISV